MDAHQIERISAWLVERGLAGDVEIALLHGFCERCNDGGLALSRGTAIIDTLHPVYEGRAFFWASDKPADDTRVSEYWPTAGSDNEESWHRSPFYHLLQSGEDELRHRLELGETGGFPILDELMQGGRDRLFRHGPAVRQGSGHRRDGLLPVALD